MVGSLQAREIVAEVAAERPPGELVDGAKVTDVATRCGVDRRTLHRWLVRYANEGLGALADRSSRPDRCPQQIAPEIEARI